LLLLLFAHLIEVLVFHDLNLGGLSCDGMCLAKAERKGRVSRSSDQQMRLICLPYAGGSSSSFASLAKALPDWLELCAIELPGRGSLLDQRPLETMTRERLLPVDHTQSWLTMAWKR
jgi:hypothetical protein